jgi:hypothetical protein
MFLVSNYFILGCIDWAVFAIQIASECLFWRIGGRWAKRQPLPPSQGTGRIHKWQYLKHASEEKIERNQKSFGWWACFVPDCKLSVV